MNQKKSIVSHNKDQREYIISTKRLVGNWYLTVER